MGVEEAKYTLVEQEQDEKGYGRVSQPRRFAQSAYLPVE